MKLLALRTLLGGLQKELQATRHLRHGLLAVAVLILGEAGLRWSDRLDAAGQRLRELRAELGELRAQTRDEAGLRASLALLETARRTVDSRLWQVSSEATGQARMKDWLDEILKRAGATGPKIALSSARVAGAAKQAGATTSDAGLREIRATVTAGFSPALLEQALFEIEGGEALAVIEALAASRRDRRIEFTVRVLFRIAPPPAVVPRGGTS